MDKEKLEAMMRKHKLIQDSPSPQKQTESPEKDLQKLIDEIVRHPKR